MNTTTLFKARPPFQTLDVGVYDCVDIDPPWPNYNRSPKGEKKSSVAIYGRMSFDDIAALPVADLLAPDAVVRLWVTWPMVLDGGDIMRHYAGHDAGRSRPGECLKAWGLRYSTGGAWLKTTINDEISMGPGYRLRSVCEPYFIAIKGAPKTKAIPNFFRGVRREHSRKPEEGFEWFERLAVNAKRRLELFSRTSRPGWDTWGYEAGKFDPVVNLAVEA
jgi:N6-adenosine-specific RNA methylase IME4